MGALLLVWVLGLATMPDQAACTRCKDTGLVACPELARHACTGTAAVRCSIAAACEACAGTRTVECAKCAREPDPERAAEVEANRAWLGELVPLDAVLGRKLAHARSAHFLLTFDIPKLDVEGGGSLHGALHLYLERLEQLWTRFAADVGATDADFSGATHVSLWSRRADQEKASVAFTRQSSSTESKLMGAAPAVSIFYDKEWLHEEFELHQAMVHQVTHCLLSNVWDGIWPGNIRAGWIDEGLAHAYEMALFGGVRHYCYVETDTILELGRGSWEPSVRSAVERDESPGFLGVAGKNTTELTPDDQLFAWSYVDFVLRAHPARFGPLARALKARKPVQQALAESLGLSPFQFEEHWRVFVKENYALKEKKKRG